MQESPVRRIQRFLLDLLFPPRCSGCGAASTAFCDACCATIVTFPTPRCLRCDLPYRPGECENRFSLCPTCRSATWAALSGFRVLGPHVEPLRGAIHALKYKDRPELSIPLGNRLAQRWRETAPAPVDGVLAVPLHPERQQQRGYNQSALLAHAIAAGLDLPLSVGYLARIRATPPQVGLDRQQRLQNIQGAFQARPEVAGQRWLLVDDVLTSGATLRACAEALREAGAREVWAITLARSGSGYTALHPSLSP